MSLPAQCVVAALVGLGAEVVWTAILPIDVRTDPMIRLERGYGWSAIWFAPAYALAPLLWPVLPPPALLWATAGLVLGDQVVRVVRRESWRRMARSLTYAPAWCLLALVLSWIVGG